jgi:MYXO-CTERM domain-containing protein
MRKYSGVLVLSLLLSVNANAFSLCGLLPFLCQPTVPKHEPTPVKMPEPNAIPETALGAAALGFYVVLRRRKRIQSSS